MYVSCSQTSYKYYVVSEIIGVADKCSRRKQYSAFWQWPYIYFFSRRHGESANYESCKYESSIILNNQQYVLNKVCLFSFLLENVLNEAHEGPL